jgi:hypothetical protein
MPHPTLPRAGAPTESSAALDWHLLDSGEALRRRRATARRAPARSRRRRQIPGRDACSAAARSWTPSLA